MAKHRGLQVRLHYGPQVNDFEYIKWNKREGLIEYRLRDDTVYPKP
jgi:hypothetical protein